MDQNNLLITVRPVSKTYDGTCVLSLENEISLEDGKIYVLLGPNGSGKSTFAKILAGIIPADGGEKPFASSVKTGYMPQKPYAFHMSTEKNLRLAVDDRQTEAELVRQLNLKPLLNKKANRLSGGETARMALARVLLKPFGLLILDEPAASLDMETTAASEQAILSYRDRHRVPILVITHSITQARRIGDELLFFKDGKLVESGPCKTHLDTPQTSELRQFLEFYG